MPDNRDAAENALRAILTASSIDQAPMHADPGADR